MLSVHNLSSPLLEEVDQADGREAALTVGVSQTKITHGYKLWRGRVLAK
jgi:hypothetical protein